MMEIIPSLHLSAFKIIETKKLNGYNIIKLNEKIKMKI